jgi:hypothetical protein
MDGRERTSLRLNFVENVENIDGSIHTRTYHPTKKPP